MVVVTVNRRLSREFKKQRALHKGTYATFIGPIMAFDDFIHEIFTFQRVHQPVWRLTPAQEYMLWAESMSGFHTLGFAKEQTIHMAQDAYALIKSYQLSSSHCQGYKQDSDLFLQAMDAFESTCTALNAFSSKALIETILSQDIVPRHEKMICEGFDEFTPAQQALLDVLASKGVQISMAQPASQQATTIKTTALNADHEWQHAAAYAKTVYEKGETIAIVVPTLQAVWHEAERHMAAVFNPGHHFPGSDGHHVPYNLSSGESLSKQPIIYALLQSFEYLHRDISIQTWSNLLHSPFIKGGESESSERAVFDLRLHDMESLHLSIDAVQQMFNVMPPIFKAQLNTSLSLKAPEASAQSIHAWMDWLNTWIAGWGWAQERTLSSAEYQAVNMFYNAIESLYPLDTIKSSFTLHEFLNQLHAVLKETLFQIETQDKPIQVLGLLEAAGLSFDHVWVIGLTADTFPGKASPHPFLPVHVQIQHNMPHCSPAREVMVAKRLLDRIIHGANHVVLSYAQQDEAGEVQLESPLISRYLAQSIDSLVTIAPLMRHTIAHCQHLDAYADHVGVPLRNLHVKGGSALFKDQSACPHRAYLKHRLKAQSPLDPVMGLSARAQGKIIHRLFEHIWRSLKSQADLNALDNDQLISSLETHIDRVLHEWKPALSNMNKKIEAKRLIDLSHAWMQFELTRTPFHVSTVEERIEATICGLTLKLTIDRIDRLDQDQLLLIDYKTGDAKTSAWEDERMDEPQLPLYAAVMDPSPQGIAFATLHKNKLGLAGISTAEVEGVAALSSMEWQGLLQSFRERLSVIAEEIKSGYAALQPKNGSVTCERCECQPGCRLYTGGVHVR